MNVWPSLAEACGIEGELGGDHGFLGDIVAGGGVAGFRLGFDGGVHLAGEGGGELERLLEGLLVSIDGGDPEWQRLAGADEIVDARDADVNGSGWTVAVERR